jgi:hypothetical protein
LEFPSQSAPDQEKRLECRRDPVDDTPAVLTPGNVPNSSPCRNTSIEEELLPGKTTPQLPYDAFLKQDPCRPLLRHDGPMGSHKSTPSILGAVLIMGIIMSASSTSASATEDSGQSHCAAAARISATFLDPYDFWDPTDERLGQSFSSMQDAGITSLIVQWNGARRADGTIATTYAPASSTGFTAWSTTLPRILSQAHQHHIAVWLGLVLQSNLLDDPNTRDDAQLLAQVAADDRLLATDLLRQYGGQFAGWYIPTEPGYASVSDAGRRELHTRYLAAISRDLRALPRDLPTMISPATATAATAGESGSWFVDAIQPMVIGSGIDVWNYQTGFKMTTWSVDDDAALIRAAAAAATRTTTTVWADAYTPGPGQDNGPTTFDELEPELHALASLRIPISTWTFDAAMNPDPGRADMSARQQLYRSYAQIRCPS